MILRWLRPLLLAAILCAPALARAQETQVALDVAGKVDKVERALAEQIGLFVDKYPDFKEATLFESPGPIYVLEVLVEVDGKTSRSRVPMTGAEVETLRRQVTDLIAAKAPTMMLNQDGRAYLLTATTLLALFFYDWSIPVALGLDSTGGAALGLAVGAGGFFLPFLLTSNSTVTHGDASLATQGLTRGILHGAAVAGLAGSELEFSGLALLLDLFSIVEGIGGYQFSRGLELPDGHAHFVGVASDLTTLAAMELGTVIGGTEFLGKPLAGAILAGGYGGYALGHLLAPSLELSMGDAEVLRATGLLGMGIGAAISVLLPSTGDVETAARVFTGLALAGGVGGALFGGNFISGAEFTMGQALFGYLAMLGGSLLASAPLVFGDIGRFSVLLPIGGATLGYVGMMYSYLDEARAASRAVRRTTTSSLRLQLNPLPILARASSQVHAAGLAEESMLRAPVISLVGAF